MAIHAQKQQIGWVECAGGVTNSLQGDVSKPSIEVRIWFNMCHLFCYVLYIHFCCIISVAIARDFGKNPYPFVQVRLLC